MIRSLRWWWWRQTYIRDTYRIFKYQLKSCSKKGTIQTTEQIRPPNSYNNKDSTNTCELHLWLRNS
jgi:hypothetical protein